MRLPNGMGSVYRLSGKRRKPFIVRKTVGWDINRETGKAKQRYITIGYAKTKQEGIEMLTEYNHNPYDVEAAKTTFADVYEKWSAEKYPTISDSNKKSYSASFSCCTAIHNKIFKDLKLTDLQGVVDTCGKNYPTLRKLKVLFTQMYDYGMKYEICNKNYAKHVNIAKYKDRNPNRTDRTPFSKEEIDALWIQANNIYAQIVLMMIYSGVRVSELLDLKRENVFLEEHYFKVVKSKTQSGIRVVPIHNKTYPFFKAWFDDGCEYLVHTPEREHFIYRNYYDSYWAPVMELIGCKHKPHDTRHTCVSLLTEKGVSPTLIKMIIGHEGSMSLTERVYTHVNVKELLDAINKI